MHVVITGSTRGIGRGLADALLARGAAVTLSGRTQASVEAAVAELQAAHEGRVAGTACDVRSVDQLERLWEYACATLGAVDVWVNNAGVSAPRVPLWELPVASIDASVDTNLRGSLHGTRIALRGMRQQGHGMVYNLEGFGSGGQVADGMAVYGSTKRAISYLRDALSIDVAGSGVRVGSIAPGIVATDLLPADYVGQPEKWEQARAVFNLMGDRVETVAPFLADRILAGDDRIRWMTPGKARWRRISARFRSRPDLFAGVEPGAG